MQKTGLIYVQVGIHVQFNIFDTQVNMLLHSELR